MDYGKLETINWILTIAFAAVVAVFAWYLLKQKADKEKETNKNKHTGQAINLQLQAYERLTLLAERTKPENLVSRLHQTGSSAFEMLQIFIQNIRQEYEYNLSQQIYVDATLWAAIQKMKDQNIYLLNQLASTLSQEATGMELNRAIVQFSINNPNAILNNLVLDAIQFEAKKLM